MDDITTLNVKQYKGKCSCKCLISFSTSSAMSTKSNKQCEYFPFSNFGSNGNKIGSVSDYYVQLSV